MFRKMLNMARDRWYDSTDCTIHNLIEYIIQTGQMRDAQIEAIKSYLFLKIYCENKPLELLFRNGAFNNIDLNDVELSETTRVFLEKTPAAAALFEYACQKNEEGDQVSLKLEKQIKNEPESIDYYDFFKKAFYGMPGCKMKCATQKG